MSKEIYKKSEKFSFRGDYKFSQYKDNFSKVNPAFTVFQFLYTQFQYTEIRSILDAAPSWMLQQS